jgi:hypothetical protein
MTVHFVDCLSRVLSYFEEVAFFLIRGIQLSGIFSLISVFYFFLSENILTYALANSEELHNLYSSPNIIRMSKSRRMGCRVI